MPTSEKAPSARVLEKISAYVVAHIHETGWRALSLKHAVTALGVSDDELAQACPNGISTLIADYLTSTVTTTSTHLSEADLEAMRIREKITFGVETWLNNLSEHHTASVKALDWCRARPLGPLPMAELTWSVADAIWSGIGDDSTGFTFASKRTTLSAVILSTLTVWRSEVDDATVWKGFLDRRIDDVMTFEKVKASIKIPVPF